MKAAMYHVVSDALGSVGAIAAGLVMIFTGWYYADSIISILISVLILRGAWTLIRDSSHILLEGTPSRLDIDAVEKSIASHAGVKSVHDLHAWTLTEGHEALSAHLVISDMQSGEALMGEIKSLLLQKFHISHVTLQLETEECDEAGSPCYGNTDPGKI
jgi:cobalt-zinc-cadmium efflux system protein